MSENEQLAEEYHPQQTPPPVRLSKPLSLSSCQKWSINQKLLPVKGYYFHFMAAIGTLLPFIGVYMQHLHLSSEETGVIYGIMPFIGFFVRPLIGAACDKYKKHKLVLIFVTALTGVFYFLLLFVPRRPVAPPHQIINTTFACNTQDSYLQDCHDKTRSDGCNVGLTYYANSTNFNNRSLSCFISCQTKPSSALPEFRACFTNETGSYDANCFDGLQVHSRQLNFQIPDLQKLLINEITRDRQLIGSLQCWDYDIKDISFGQSSAQKALQILCERELFLDCLVNCSQVSRCTEYSSPFDLTFASFFIIFLMANIMFAPVFPILDAAVYEILEDNRHDWGKQRMWGTFGFALFAVTSTFTMFLQQRTGREVDYTISFYVFLPLCIIAAIIANFLTISTNVRCGQFVRNVCQLLLYKEVSAFLFVVMYFGILTGGLEAFLFWYLGDIGSSPLVFGFVLLVECCAEVPMLWAAGAIIKKAGLVSCLYLALVCYAVRLIVYSFLQEPWLVLLVEPLYGVCFGLMYAAASSYASIIAPPGMATTVQGLLGGVHFGFGKGLGSLLTGFMFKGLGPRWTWRVYCIVTVIVLIVYMGLNMLVFKSSHHSGPPVARQPADVSDKDGYSRNAGDGIKQEETLISCNSHEERDGSAVAPLGSGALPRS